MEIHLFVGVISFIMFVCSEEKEAIEADIALLRNNPLEEKYRYILDVSK